MSNQIEKYRPTMPPEVKDFWAKDAEALIHRYLEALERIVPVLDEAMTYLSLAKHGLHKAGVVGYLDKINTCQEEGENALAHARAALRPEGGGPISPCSPCAEGPASRTNQTME